MFPLLLESTALREVGLEGLSDQSASLPRLAAGRTFFAEKEPPKVQQQGYLAVTIGPVLVLKPVKGLQSLQLRPFPARLLRALSYKQVLLFLPLRPDLEMSGH